MSCRFFRRLFLVAIVLAAAVTAASQLQAQQPGANPNVLRFCPGSGIPCVEINHWPARIKSSRRLRSSKGMSPLLSIVIQPL